MNVEQAYNIWANQYDTNKNRTRDIEAISLRESLANMTFDNCLEIGCGTGKNTEYLATITQELTSVDFSEEMLAKAKQKIKTNNVQFIQADITKEWFFATKPYDLVTFSLVLEHIEDLNEIMKKVASVTTSKSIVYIGELHPFKQYTGSKARFEIENGQQIVTCFNHNISDFTMAAKMHGFDMINIAEYFDDNDRKHYSKIIDFGFAKK